MTNPAQALDLPALLEAMRAKFIGPDEFWDLYQNSNAPLRVLTANIEILKSLLKDPSILEQSDRVTVDSALLQRTLERLYGQRFTRLTGRAIVENSPAFLANRPVVICGASDEARRKTSARMNERGAQDGQLWLFDEPAILQPRPPRPIAGFFAYGYPKQEEKLDLFRSLNPDIDGIFIGVGGAVDYFAGIMRRPPTWVVRAGIEWLWRLLLQPQARIKRVISIVPIALRLKLLKAPARGPGQST